MVAKLFQRELTGICSSVAYCHFCSVLASATLAGLDHLAQGGSLSLFFF